MSNIPKISPFYPFFKLANTVEKIFLQNPLISAYYKRDRVYIFVIGYSLQSKHSLRLYYTHIVNSAVMYRLPKSRVFSLTKYRFHGKKNQPSCKISGMIPSTQKSKFMYYTLNPPLTEKRPKMHCLYKVF